MDSLDRFKEPWKGRLSENVSTACHDFPNYHVSDPDSLVCTSRPHVFQLGTGASIYTQSLLPAILQARREVILVTCFWAQSSTLTALKEALEKLAAVRREQISQQRSAGPDAEDIPPLNIRICFSSRSLFQKLFHTSSRTGVIYPSSSWHASLGLPDGDTLESGRINLQVKSLFFLPFSVMHPKFLIIDRQRAWLPSCNVSWEAWLEGCVEVTGDVVSALMRFYRDVWDQDLEADLDYDPNPMTRSISSLQRTTSIGRLGLSSIKSHASRFAVMPGDLVPTVLLPSSHHRNPRFRPLPWQKNPPAPVTPLNTAILRLLDMAEMSIYIQTPNLTSAPAIDGVVEALKRGIDVTIVTSRGMMVLEQIVTAGTTTSLCLKSLIRRYKQCRNEYLRFGTRGATSDSHAEFDLEAQPPRLGSLKISYFRPRERKPADHTAEEPVHSHLKLTIVDGQWTVLGSGNLDRASFFTSQELGILFQSPYFAATVRDAVGEVLKDRLTVMFDSRLLA
ncbi:hypothetical protein F4778DRAFT_781648 [Xylariomycetidae sp. FL2044]|nr:hypothetical protein F4778DRAFT_781648 [Xylariomycetidae sp. FL2044]